MPELETGEVGTTDSTPLSGGADSTTSTASTSPYELKDDSLVSIPGQSSPVKFGEWYKGFQASQTKATQKAAQLEKQFKEFQERYAALERAQQMRQATQATPAQKSRLAALREQARGLAYMDGNSADVLLETFEQELNSRDERFNQAVQALQLMYQKFQGLEKSFSGISTKTAQGEFDQKINKWLEEGGYPAELKDLAQELYLAYEGDDLDQEFPSILKNRWEQIQRATRLMDQKNRDAARARQMPGLPGKGGAGIASKNGFKPSMGAKEIADLMWPRVEGGQDT